MQTSGHEVLVQQRLSTLLLQVECANTAHTSLRRMAGCDENDAVVSLLTRLQELAKMPKHETLVCGGSRCEYHANIDAALCEADRLLQSDRHIAQLATQRAAQDCCVSPAHQFDMFGNLAVIEAFVATAKALAYQILSALAISQMAN